MGSVFANGVAIGARNCRIIFGEFILLPFARNRRSIGVDMY
jgi:hypothetical protein